MSSTQSRQVRLAPGVRRSPPEQLAAENSSASAREKSQLIQGALSFHDAAAGQA